MNCQIILLIRIIMLTMKGLLFLLKDLNIRIWLILLTDGEKMRKKAMIYLTGRVPV